MTDETDDIDEIKEKLVCAVCVGDAFLKHEIRTSGQNGKCSYCGQTRKGMWIDDFADYIETALDHHYRLSSQDYWPDHEPVGEPVRQLIQEAAQIDEPPAEDVRIVLEHRNQRFGKDAIGEDNAFSEDAHYRFQDIRAGLYADEWARFRKSVETEARMFNSEAEGILNEIFEGLEDCATRHGRKLIVCAGPGCPINALYRARVFQSDDKLEAAIARPDRELGSPPREHAMAGRMNSRGIGVFYGATHPKVALAETRPPVGSRVLVGRFEIVRHLWLLDLDAMRSIKAKGSIFQESYAEELERTAFLSTLSDFMTRPVMPEDETSEYLTTQAIADYLATRDSPEVDGIIYPSVQQSGKLKRNVVLFHKAACVHDLGLPRRTQIDAYLHESDEDGTRPNYSVSIQKPSERKKEVESHPGIQFEDGDMWDPFPDPRRDKRNPALRIDLSSVKVHHITGVSFREYNLSVERREYEMSQSLLKKLQEDEPPF